mmetsp:Transcript_82386/g.166969  ORF Transcript_82386/g.166969 Transcript_82386/m.166969 type:complete len:88 (+) Transcript_82386:507-770(+)
MIPILAKTIAVRWFLWLCFPVIRCVPSPGNIYQQKPQLVKGHHTSSFLYNPLSQKDIICCNNWDKKRGLCFVVFVDTCSVSHFEGLV